MFFTRPCQYAIRALVYLATRRADDLCQVKEIAAAEGLPAPTLAGILKNLARAGLVQSRTGPRGGFALARRAEHITLCQIMDAVGQTDVFSQCVVGFETCSDDMPCPVHDRFQEMRQRFVERSQSVSVADMAAAVARKRRQTVTEWGGDIDRSS